MAELNFCPYCGGPSHKLLRCSEAVFFCKECNQFFSFGELKLKCPKCNKTNIQDSQFPSPGGEAIFQCSDCKKMTSASEFFKHNKIK